MSVKRQWNPDGSFARGAELKAVDATTIKDVVNSSLKSEDKWLTSIEAAAYLCVTRKQLWNLTSSGSVPFYKLGRSNRYRLSELESLLFRTRRGNGDIK